MAVGAKIRLYIDDEIIYQEQNPMRGFESTVDYKLVFGLGTNNKIDSLTIVWPGDMTTTLVNVKVNQLIKLEESAAKFGKSVIEIPTSPLFKRYLNHSLDFTHIENDYVDFNKDRLLFHMNSTEGPCICKGDVNNDGKDDLYIGGASGQTGKLFIQSDNGDFYSTVAHFENDAHSEDLDCVFFDADGDGNQDLYINSGGSEFSSLSIWLNDRLYFGNGNGGFVKTSQKLPFKGFESTSTVVPLDYDSDGDQDLFIGGRSVPFYYGVPADSYLLENDGKGGFTKVENESTNILNRLGMVTDATLADIDGDGTDELVVVGRWMPIKIFKITKGIISDISDEWDLDKSNGWYNTVEAEDLNGDGRIDLLVGNHGLNTRFHTSIDEPIELLVNDFDNNGSFEQIISMYSKGQQYPFVQLKELAMQLPAVAQRYTSFNDYKSDETDAVFPDEIRAKGFVMETFNLATGIYINNGKKLIFEKLPTRAQFSPVYAFKTGDFDNDGKVDIVLGGNFNQSKPEVGTYNANFGALFKGLGEGLFQFIPNSEAGFRIEGNIRDVEELQIENKKVLVFTRNNRRIYTIEYDPKR